MKIYKTAFNGLKVIQGLRFDDNRGNFRELYKHKLFKRKKFIVWNLSKSKKNVVRGLHLQKRFQQEKFVSVAKGKILDVAVDLRRGSKTFCKSFKIVLSDKNCKSIFIPAGFAHGFCGIDKENFVLYGCNKYRSKNDEIGILWNDKKLNIKWNIKKPIVSKKDKLNISLNEFLNKKLIKN